MPNPVDQMPDSDATAATDPHPAAPPKFRRRKEARPDEILDAALALFCDKGFAKTRVEDVARRAGVSKGAVYLYFPSKDALIEALVDRAVGGMAGHAVQICGAWQGDPRPLLVQMARMAAGVLSDPATFAVPKLVIHEAPSQPKLAKMYHDKILSRVLPALTGLLERGIAGGHIRAVDPEMAVRSVLGPILMHVLLADIFDEVPAQGLDFEGLLETHMTLLIAGLAPDAAPEKDHPHD